MKKKIKAIKKFTKVMEKLQVNPETVDVNKAIEFINTHDNVMVLLNNNKTTLRLTTDKPNEYLDFDVTKKSKQPYKVHVGEEAPVEAPQMPEEMPMELKNFLSQLFGIKNTVTTEHEIDDSDEKEEEIDPFDNVEEFNIGEIKNYCSQFNNKVVRAINRGNIFVVIFDNEVEFHFNTDGTISIVK